MRRRIEYHNDGSTRMDWYTFASLPARNMVESIRERGLIRIQEKAALAHPLKPKPTTSSVKEFA